MRSRRVREGSLGLLLLMGMGLFVVLVFWLRGIPFSRNSYTAIVKFANAGGMQVGAPVRYRGVTVGKIIGIKPGPHGVDVQIEISPADLIIPLNIMIEANQAGLISETAIDITPIKEIANLGNIKKPLDADCDRTLIICDRSQLAGEVGVSLNDLLRVTVKLGNILSDPTFITNFTTVVKNAATASEGVTQLTHDLSSLTQTVEDQIKILATSAVVSADAINRTTEGVSSLVNQIGGTTSQLNHQLTQTTNQINVAAQQIGITANQANRQIELTANNLNRQINSTADQANQTTRQLGTTSNKINQLVDNLDTLLVTNRNTLTKTLNEISETSTQLHLTVANFTPLVNQIKQGQLLQNLEVLSANAAKASANLRDLSNAANNPTNLLLLQQTLDSARATFQNAQKITSDLDDLTGDPAFRNNLRRLVNGLSGLVSSTQELQKQAELAKTLAPLTETMNKQITPLAAEVNQSAPRVVNEIK